MAALGLLGEGSVMVRRMRAFAVASEMGRGGVSVAVAATFADSSAVSLPALHLLSSHLRWWWVHVAFARPYSFIIR